LAKNETNFSREWRTFKRAAKRKGRGEGWRERDAQRSARRGVWVDDWGKQTATGRQEAFCLGMGGGDEGEPIEESTREECKKGILKRKEKNLSVNDGYHQTVGRRKKNVFVQTRGPGSRREGTGSQTSKGGIMKSKTRGPISQIRGRKHWVSQASAAGSNL